jgi:hypothetical protein
MFKKLLIITALLCGVLHAADHKPGSIRLNTTTNELEISVQGGAWVSIGTYPIKAVNAVSGNGTDLTITAANGGTGNGNGGSIRLVPGAKNGSGTDGATYLDANSNSYVLRTGAGYFYSGDAGVSVGVRSDRGLGTPGAGYLSIISGSNYFTFGSQLVAANTSQYSWYSGGTPGANAGDTGLAREAAGVATVTDGGSGAGILSLKETTGGTVASNTVRVYAKDVSGTSQLYAKNDAGTEYALTPTASGGVDILRAVTSSDFDKNANTTLSDVTNLSVTLASSKKYAIEVHLFTNNASSASGLKVSCSTTATLASIRGTQKIWDLGTRALSAVTTVTSTGTATTKATIASGDHEIICHYTVDCTTTGDFKAQFAQGSSDATNTTVKAGSFIIATPLN